MTGAKMQESNLLTAIPWRMPMQTSARAKLIRAEFSSEAARFFQGVSKP
jgi:hypothetical protein